MLSVSRQWMEYIEITWHGGKNPFHPDNSHENSHETWKKSGPIWVGPKKIYRRNYRFFLRERVHIPPFTGCSGRIIDSKGTEKWSRGYVSSHEGNIAPKIPLKFSGDFPEARLPLVGASKLVWGCYSIWPKKKSLHQNHFPSKIRGGRKVFITTPWGIWFFSHQENVWHDFVFLLFDVQLIS